MEGSPLANFDPSSIGATPVFDPSSIGAVPVQQPQASGMLPNSFSDTDLAKMPGYAMDTARAVNLGAQRFGGNILQDVGKGLSYFPGNTGIADKLQQAGGLAANLQPQDVGIQNPDAGTSFVSGAAQMAPYALLAGKMPSTATSPTTMPVMRNLIGPAAQKLGLTGLLYGSTQSPPGQSVSGGLADGLLGMVSAAAPEMATEAVQGAKTLWGMVTGKPMQEATDNAYNAISKGLAPDELNKTNTQSVIGNYKEQVKNLGNGYQDLNLAAEQRGYLPTGTKPIAGLFEQTNQKFIDPSKDTLSTLDNLINKQDPESPLKNVSSGLKSAIEQYKSSPTFANAHTLQSMLGSEAADFSSGIATDISDKQTARILNSVRNQLKNDIMSGFEKNGDKDLAETYQGLSDQWKSNVVPYQNVPGVWRAIRGKNHPANIINVLDDNDELGSNQTIREHLKANPESSQTILAQALNSAAKRDATGAYRSVPQKMIDKYNNLPENIRQLTNPGLEKQMNELQKLLDSHNAWAQPTKDLAKKLVQGLGIGAGASAGYSGYRLMKDL